MTSLTPRRSTRIRDLSTPSTPSTPSTSTPSIQNGNSTKPATMTLRKSPFLPTNMETILLAIYPATLIIGSLFSLLNPDAHAVPYSTISQSHPSDLAPSYFAKKSNLFNQIFVKRGWFWITTAYFFFLFTHPSTGPPRSPILTPRRMRGFLRWGIVTVWWILVTQWCFGPAIIDRGFRLTGGQCELVLAAENGKVDMDDTRQFLTGMACKAVGGKWKGGHDISGHVFLLVLGSMFLFEEVLHVVSDAASAREERTILMADGAVKSAAVESRGNDEVGLEYQGKWDLGVKVVMGVGALSLWMLLMTAVYFHTWVEKFTGLLVAFSGIFVVYLLPRAIPALREVIGMPGI